MKTPLHAYTKAAKDLFADCFYWYAASLRNPLAVRIAYDGELQVEGEKDLWEPDAPPVKATAVARLLDKYAKDEMRYQDRKDNVGEMAACLRLIVLGKDKTAKKRHPDEYAKLKGKAMDPLKAAAVCAIFQELASIDQELADNIYQRSYATVAAAEATSPELREKIDGLIGKVIALRGY